MAEEKQKRSKWRSRAKRCAKWAATTIGVIIVLIIAAIGTGVLMLSPDRLNKMACEYGSKYLTADVKAKRVELFFWSTFPMLRLEVDSLSIDSRALDHLSKEDLDSIPSDASRLLRVAGFRGGVNIPALLSGNIRLHDLEINSMDVNLVNVNDSIANYLIFPDSEDESQLELPDIIIDRFKLTGNSPIRYFDHTNHIDIKCSISSSITKAGEKPVYTVELSGNSDASLIEKVMLEKLRFGINGKVGWSARNPYSIELEKILINLDELAMELSANVDFSRDMKVEHMQMDMRDVKLSDLINLIPGNLRGELGKIDTDLNIDITATLTRPYNLATDSLPSAKVGIKTEGMLKYGKLRLQRVESDINVSVDGVEPDKSVIDINSLLLTGNAVNTEIKGRITDPMNDALVEATFHGGANLGHLPAKLWDRAGFEASGLLTADTKIRFRLSDLSASRYHRIKIDGSARLRDFTGTTTRGTLVDIFTRKANLKFGTSSKFRNQEGTADSLLMASLYIDTAAVKVSGNMLFSGSELQLVAGMKNIASTRDTNVINPIGAKLTAGLLKMQSDIDSMTISLRNTSAKGVMKRFNNDKHHAQMILDFASNRLRFTDPRNRIGLLDTEFKLDFHPKAKPKYTQRMQNRMDSLRRVYPDLSEDSIKTLARAIGRRNPRHAMEIDSAGHSTMDIELDPSIFGWINRLDAKVSLTARGGRMISAFFPMKTAVRGFGIHFDTDSIAIDTLRIRSGQSVMRLSGGIGNLRRATRRKSEPINAHFDITADTINVNEIADAIFKATSSANQRSNADKIKMLELTDSMTDAEAEAKLETEKDSTAAIALIVPSNLSASMNIRAKNVLYSDIWFQRLQGRINVFEGAINLDRLGAYTPIGSIDLTALYQAPDMNNLKFAAGLVVRELQLKKFLDMMPDVKTLMPLLKDVQGIVTAEMAMTTDLDSLLDLRFSTLDAMMRLTGDSLVLIDNETFRSIGKWLMLKKKDRNMIDHMDVEVRVKDNRLELYPFVFDFDRYKLGVSGSNDLDLNLDYHVAVLKSPIPFKFGVNIKGKPGHLRIKLGGAHFNENVAFERRTLTDTARINLVKEIEKVFHFGVRSGRKNARLQRLSRPNAKEFSVADTLTHSDSLFLIQQGVLERPADFIMTTDQESDLGIVESNVDKKKDKKKKDKKRRKNEARRKDN